LGTHGAWLEKAQSGLTMSTYEETLAELIRLRAQIRTLENIPSGQHERKRLLCRACQLLTTLATPTLH
jgi:hypothetical protein